MGYRRQLDMLAVTRVDRGIAAAAAVVLLVASMVPAWRGPITVAMLAIAAALWISRRAVPIGLVAVLPVLVGMSWAAWLGPDVPLGAAGCAEPLSVIAARRIAVAVVVGLGVVALLRSGRFPPALMALRGPSGREVAAAALGGAAIAVAGLVIGPAVAEPFFGRLAFERPLAAIVPALLFGLSNGLLEELAYRGVLQGLLGQVVGRRAAIVVQAVVFGIVHVGPDVTAFIPVHAALMASAGLVAGLIVDRTRSLVIPIGIHVGADVALYFGLACRVVTA